MTKQAIHATSAVTPQIEGEEEGRQIWGERREKGEEDYSARHEAAAVGIEVLDRDRRMGPVGHAAGDPLNRVHTIIDVLGESLGHVCYIGIDVFRQRLRCFYARHLVALTPPSTSRTTLGTRCVTSKVLAAVIRHILLA